MHFIVNVNKAGFIFFKLSSEYLHSIYLISTCTIFETCYVFAYMSRIYHMKYRDRLVLASNSCFFRSTLDLLQSQKINFEETDINFHLAVRYPFYFAISHQSLIPRCLPFNPKHFTNFPPSLFLKTQNIMMFLYHRYNAE